MNMNLTLTPLNTTSFQAQRPKIKYNEIRNIPNVPCASCGKKVLIPETLRKILSSISRPLSSMLKLGSFSNWENNSAIMELLKKLAEANPKKSFHSIVEEEENYKQVQEILQPIAKKKAKKQPEETNRYKLNLFKDLLNNSESTLRSSGVVMKKLAQLKSYIDGTPLEVFEQLEIYSRKYPRKTLTEIINMDEIARFHRMKNLLQRAETREKIDFHFENIQQIINKVIPHPQEYYNELKENALEIFATEKDPIIRIAKIKAFYMEFLRKNQCEQLANKINKEIDQMPITYTTKDSFFVFAHDHNFDDRQIISSIFSPIISTFEHVVPKSQKGANKMKNGLVMHQRCNCDRSNMSYRKFFRYHPEMPKNIQKQINFITRLILKGKLDGAFRFWPMTISKTLFDYTDGAVNLDITKYCEKGLEQTTERIETRQGAIDKLKNDRDAKISQKQELLRQIKSLEGEIEGIGNTTIDLIQENQNEKNLISSYEAYINKKKPKQE